jgi:hypothetical protein
MKTKRANRDYTCAKCKCEIRKGDQYAKKSIVIGDTIDIINGVEFRSPFREAVPFCSTCANPAPVEG